MLTSKLLIFKVGKSKYACNTTCVDRIIKYENLTYLPSIQKTLEGVYNHEGTVINIYNLSRRLGVESYTDKTHKKIIIVKNNDVLVGIVVDEVLEVFNYNKENSENTCNTKNAENINGINFRFVKDMILLNGEIVIYLSMSKIVEIELEESKL